MPSVDDYDLTLLLRGPEEYAKKLTIKKLEDLILLLKDYYYNTETPLVPDLIYDQIEDVLRQRSPNNPILMVVGSPVKGDAVKLPYPMPSLNKAKAGAGTTQKWLNKYPGPYVLSHKLDGISMMYYKKKNVVHLFTRGDGIEGHDISYNLKELDMGKIKIPSNIDPVAIRGEMVILKSVWDKYYANDNPSSRNWVSGKVKSTTSSKQDLGRIRFVAYQIMHPRMIHSEQMKLLKDWGFHVAPYSIEPNLTEKVLQKKLDEARDNGPYQIDGLVIIQDDAAHPLTTENPKHSIAFKSQSEEVAQTKVIKVLWKGSKRFLMKPTVVIEPVFLSGGNLTRATGHYAKYIVDNQIGPGAIVTIVRSGEVIPFIVSVDKKAAYADLPEVDYEWTDNGLDIRVNEETDEISHAILVHMVKTLNIENLGPGTLSKLIEMGYTTPTEILNITLDELQEVESLGKNAEKIWASLLKLQTEGVRLSQLMDASNIFETGVGTRIMQLVLDHYPDILDMVEDDQLVKKLVKIKGIEQKTAEKIVNGLPKFVEFLDELPQIVIKDDEESEESDLAGNPALKGMRVVFTGVRDKELESLITRSGGEVASGVSKTHPNQVVVAKDTSGSSNKIKAAQSLKLKIYNLEAFKEKYEI